MNGNLIGSGTNQPSTIAPGTTIIADQTNVQFSALMRSKCDALVLIAYDIAPSPPTGSTLPYDVAGCIGQINGRPFSAYEWKCTPIANAVGNYQARCYDDRNWPGAVNAFGCVNGGSNTVSCPYLSSAGLSLGAIPGGSTLAAAVVGISPAAQWFWTSGYG